MFTSSCLKAKVELVCSGMLMSSSLQALPVPFLHGHDRHPVTGLRVLPPAICKPRLLVDTLPMLMSRSSLKWLRDILFPFLTLEVEDVLPH